MKNLEELKEAIKGNSFNESHLSKTQVVDLETVIGLIEDFEQCNIANVSNQRELLIAAFERLNRTTITMIEVGDYDKAADEILSY